MCLILEALTDELQMFDAKYSQKGFYNEIIVKGYEKTRFYILIEKENFIIDQDSLDKPTVDDVTVHGIPIGHPNSIESIIKFLHNNCPRNLKWIATDNQ